MHLGCTRAIALIGTTTAGTALAIALGRARGGDAPVRGEAAGAPVGSRELVRAIHAPSQGGLPQSLLAVRLVRELDADRDRAVTIRDAAAAATDAHAAAVATVVRQAGGGDGAATVRSVRTWLASGTPRPLGAVVSPHETTQLLRAAD